jgi:sugar/nucleoside kinase (ribokinase family)
MENYGGIEAGRKLIAGIGSALVDILAREEDDFLQRSGMVKGGMKLVDRDTIDRMLSLTSDKPIIVPGGSACNTILGIGKLGGWGRFVGKRGIGPMGRLFEDALRDHGVEPALMTSPLPTGRVFSVITPDAQRSMLTYLGASSETLPVEVSNGCFHNAAVVHLEGYLMFNRELMLSALTSAKAAGARISLDLGSFTVVEESRDFLKEIVADLVDILIANEDEARVYTGVADECRAVAVMGENVDIAVLKVGARGSYIRHSGRTLAVAPQGDGSAVDSTGAGDLWASGFLHGLVAGFPLEKCGELGSACGYEVCQVTGATIPDAAWQRIRRLLPAEVQGGWPATTGDGHAHTHSDVVPASGPESANLSASPNRRPHG